MKRTINGKCIAEIMNELCMPFPKNSIKTRDNKPYISADSYRKRFNDVIGLCNYYDEYTELKIVNVKDSCVVTVKLTLHIYDDNCTEFLKKDIYGGANVIFPNVINEDTGRKESLTTSTTVNNTITTAEQDAFKRLCKRLGMGVEELAEAKKELNGELLNITLASNMRESKGNIYADVSYGNEVATLVIWGKDNVFAGIEEATIKEHLKQGRTICGYFAKDTYNGKPQLVLKALPVDACITSIFTVKEILNSKELSDQSGSILTAKSDDGDTYGLIVMKNDYNQIGAFSEIKDMTFLGEEYICKKGRQIVYKKML